MPGVETDTSHLRVKHRIQCITQCAMVYLIIQCTFMWFQIQDAQPATFEKYEII